MDGLKILPLAITMMAGPQIMSAIIFVTARDAVRVSLGFLAGVTVGVLAGVAAMMGIATALGSGVDLGNSKDRGSVGHIIQYALVGLLALAALRNWRHRKTVTPPKWLHSLMSADPRQALRTGLMVILLMPSDLMVMLTVGVHLDQARGSYLDALPFIALTVVIAALPLLVRLAAGHRAADAMPKIRDWTNTHSWLVNILVCALFIALIMT
ncbi:MULTISPECIES: GAP family protein [unclassified Streptomyces]|uniref:GAP family protein n=1 Tax=unclassified Streptomyces TaxID=2593676 RepID=UPI002DD7A895|nr:MULTISPECIES: GAP family protein [unclassified Streptomyces]WSA91701.1 GAP family protein [Streptomyces sp. NBC_01795]WSB76075.1 GAP family protein [Streptomyces sp. NBC_01775]WSS15652.1 GAP family protein [Streptomyces sp. NBC_01186]WSS44494.1 GAP family protein [Streptomyces sp. NBC_01187]